MPTFIGQSPSTALKETSGPTTLNITTIADGEFLKRSGNNVISQLLTVFNISGTPLNGYVTVFNNATEASGSSDLVFKNNKFSMGLANPTSRVEILTVTGAKTLDNPTAAMISTTGTIYAFSAASLVDSDTGTVGYGEAAVSTVGSTVKVDLGAGNEKAYVEWSGYHTGPTGPFYYSWAIEYSDNDASWTTVGSYAAGGAAAGYLTVTWANAGAHRYWRHRITASDFNGPSWTEWLWYKETGGQPVIVADDGRRVGLCSYPDTNYDITLGGTVKIVDDLTMSGNKITDLSHPTTNNDAATKYYVDTVVNSNLNVSGAPTQYQVPIFADSNTLISNDKFTHNYATGQTNINGTVQIDHDGTSQNPAIKLNDSDNGIFRSQQNGGISFAIGGYDLFNITNFGTTPSVTIGSGITSFSSNGTLLVHVERSLGPIVFEDFAARGDNGAQLALYRTPPGGGQADDGLEIYTATSDSTGSASAESALLFTMVNPNPGQVSTSFDILTTVSGTYSSRLSVAPSVIVTGDVDVKPTTDNTVNLGENVTPNRINSVHIGTGESTFDGLLKVKAGNTTSTYGNAIINIYKRVGDVTNTSGLSTLMQRMLQANMLNIDGASLSITATGYIETNANTKQLDFYFGSGNPLSYIFDINKYADWRLEMEVIRTASNNQQFVGIFNVAYDDATIEQLHFGNSSSSNDETLPILTKLQAIAPADADIVQHSMNINFVQSNLE